MIRGGTPHRSSVFRGGAAPRNAFLITLVTLVTLSLSRRGFGPHSGSSRTRAQRASLNSPALLSRSPGTASRRPGHPRQDWLEDRVALAVAAHVVLPLIPPTTAKACQYSCRDPTLTITRWAWNRLAGYGPSTVLRITTLYCGTPSQADRSRQRTQSSYMQSFHEADIAPAEACDRRSHRRYHCVHDLD